MGGHSTIRANRYALDIRQVLDQLEPVALPVCQQRQHAALEGASAHLGDQPGPLRHGYLPAGTSLRQRRKWSGDPAPRLSRLVGISPGAEDGSRIAASLAPEYTSIGRDAEMAVFGRVVTLLSSMFARRRLHWVEISVERAWSRDMAPRLFDLGPR